MGQEMEWRNTLRYSALQGHTATLKVVTRVERGFKPSNHQESRPQADAHGLQPPGRPEFAEQRGDVELGSVDRDAEAAGDELVRGARGEESQHLAFARRERDLLRLNASVCPGSIGGAFREGRVREG